MNRDPRVQRPVLSNRLVNGGAWALHTRPVSVIRIRFTNLRCREVGVKEDPLLVHATRLANELEAISSRDIQQVFGLPLNLSQKLLEMLLYRDLIQPSSKRKSRLDGRHAGFLFEADSEEEQRHLKNTEFDQLFELTESGQLAAVQGEIRPIVPKDVTLHMIEETGEFLPLNTMMTKTNNWGEPDWSGMREPPIASIVSWFEGAERKFRRVDDSIEGISLEETVRRDDFGLEQEKWAATKIQSYQKSIVPGIWASTILTKQPSIDLSKAIVSLASTHTSGGTWNRNADLLSGKITKIPFRNGSHKPRLHQGLIAIEVDEHEYRDLPDTTLPEPHRIRIQLAGKAEIEALVRPLPTQKNIANWCEDMIDVQMRKLPDGSLGRAEVDQLVETLRTSATELWSDPNNQTQTWHNALIKNLQATTLDSVLTRYRDEGEWELQYRIDEREVFQNAD
jgi:hypothetical protein